MLRENPGLPPFPRMLIVVDEFAEMKAEMPKFVEGLITVARTGRSLGVHLVLEGYLAYRSGYVPRVLGVLLVLAGLGYAFDSFRVVLSAGSPLLVSTVTFVGEFLLCLWLLVRGRRLSAVPGPRLAAPV